MASLRLWIWVLSWLPSLVVTEHEMTCTDQCMHASEHRHAWDRCMGLDMHHAMHSMDPSYRARHSASAAQGCLGGDKDVGHVLQGRGGVTDFSISRAGVIIEGGTEASDDCLLRTLSSASSGRCSRISNGSVSAAITTNSEIPRFRVLVAAMAYGMVQNVVCE